MEGYAEHVEHSIALAAYARELLQAKGWKILNNSPLAVLCAIPPGRDVSVTEAVSRMLAGGSSLGFRRLLRRPAGYPDVRDERRNGPEGC